MAYERISCSVGNCYRSPIVFDDDTGEHLCERHMPDPSVRSWSDMKAEGIEIETMSDYQNEVRGFNDYDPPENYYDDIDEDYLYGME